MKASMASELVKGTPQAASSRGTATAFVAMGMISDRGSTLASKLFPSILVSAANKTLRDATLRVAEVVRQDLIIRRLFKGRVRPPVSSELKTLAVSSTELRYGRATVLIDLFERLYSIEIDVDAGAGRQFDAFQKSGHR